MPAPFQADAAFRAEVAALRAVERRRRFPLGVHVGTPEGVRRRLEVPWPMPERYDDGLRFDLADALVDDLAGAWPTDPGAWGWLTRPGEPELHDCDLAWLAATNRAFAARDLPLAGFRAVTRTGWLDVVTLASRRWKRLRR